jgi:hypothetical protein
MIPVSFYRGGPLVVTPFTTDPLFHGFHRLPSLRLRLRLRPLSHTLPLLTPHFYNSSAVRYIYPPSIASHMVSLMAARCFASCRLGSAFHRRFSSATSTDFMASIEHSLRGICSACCPRYRRLRACCRYAAAGAL